RMCFHVTKPTGRLALSTNLVGHMRGFYEVYRETLVELEMPECLAALETHTHHRATPEGIVALLGRTGFTDVELETDAFVMRFADGSSLLRHAFIRMAFVPAWKRVVPAGAVERTFAALERKLNVVAAKRGELALTIPMAYVEARKRGGGRD